MNNILPDIIVTDAYVSEECSWKFQSSNKSIYSVHRQNISLKYSCFSFYFLSRLPCVCMTFIWTIFMCNDLSEKSIQTCNQIENEFSCIIKNKKNCIKYFIVSKHIKTKCNSSLWYSINYDCAWKF